MRARGDLDERDTESERRHFETTGCVILEDGGRKKIA